MVREEKPSLLPKFEPREICMLDVGLRGSNVAIR